MASIWNRTRRYSNIKRTLLEYKRNGSSISPGDILDSLLDVLGQQGTLLLPLFNFDFTQGVPFDIRTTPSQMGSLTEVARKHKDAIRTGHPIYSFAVIGNYQKLFSKVDNESAYAEDSTRTFKVKQQEKNINYMCEISNVGL